MMKATARPRRRIEAVLISMLFGLSIFGVLAVAEARATSTACNPVPHPPVLIQSDGDFTAANGVVSGSGTANVPFVISSLKLDDLSRGFGLKIDNSKGKITAFFNVQCLQTTYLILPSKGNAYLLELVNVHTSTTVFNVSGNGGETARTLGVLVQSSSQITLNNLQFNKLGFDATDVVSSDHVTIIDSKLKATAPLGGGDGLFISNSHDIQVGQVCNVITGHGCNDLTYDDGRGLHILNSYNILVQNTVTGSDDTTDILIEGSHSSNITLNGSSAQSSGPICTSGTFHTGIVVDTVSGLAITSGAHGITVRNYAITSNFIDIMNGGNGLWLNPCTGVKQPVPVTPPGGGGYTFVNVCWMHQFGFNPVPARSC